MASVAALREKLLLTALPDEVPCVSTAPASRWKWPLAYEVVHSPRVAVREQPSTGSPIVGSVACGDVVYGDREQGGFVGRFGDVGWILIDGHSLGLGKLLRRVPAAWERLRRVSSAPLQPPSVTADDDHIRSHYVNSILAPALLPSMLIEPHRPLAAQLCDGPSSARAHLAARLIAMRGFCLVSSGLEAALLDSAELEAAALHATVMVPGQTVDPGSAKEYTSERVRGDKVAHLGEESERLTAAGEDGVGQLKTLGSLAKLCVILENFAKAVVRELGGIEVEGGHQACFTRADDGKPLFYHSRSDMMISCYPGGDAAYRAHIDNPGAADERRFTVLLYLNKAWHDADDGGALRLHVPPEVSEVDCSRQASPVVDVYPHAGAIVIFRSDRIMHEVRPATKHLRFACSIWVHAGTERKPPQKLEPPGKPPPPGRPPSPDKPPPDNAASSDDELQLEENASPRSSGSEQLQLEENG